MIRKILLLSLALVLCFAFVGCAQKGEVLTPEQIDQIVTEAVSAAVEANTYQFDMDMSVTMEVIGGTEPGTMTMDAVGTGAIDNVHKEMQMLMTMTMNIPEQGEQEMGMETYIVGEWMYMEMSVPEMDEQWMKMELPEGMWETQNQLEQQMELLETAAEVKFVDSEIVDDVDCYIFEITPDMEKLADYLSQQLGMEGINLGELNLAELFKEMSVKEWIAKDSYLLTKTEVHMLMELTPEDVGATSEDFERMTMDLSMGMTVHDYNQPVSIELPPEAQDAIEMPGM